ncbi:hypothetical protein HDU89_005683 [Geranomyces variabilis]|nr:hypothetical protein HDU89_005683 [Geranomyces variabilis]
MREDWDGLFDPLTSGIVYTGPAKETVLASKARKVAEADSTNRGKQADKCWKLASGLEVCWLEAAKDDAENPTKYESDLLKVLKGCKDMADRIFHKTRICAEVFGIVTSRHDAQLLSVVRISRI